MVDIGHMKGNYAVLVQRLEKQADVGVKKTEKSMNQQIKKKL